MRIHYEQSGGLAGLDINATVNTNSLPSDEVNKLQDLVNKANFFSLNSVSSPPEMGADYFHYRITVEMEDNENEHKKEHTVEIYDPVPAQIKPLIKYLRSKAMEQEKQQ
jgi:hypothetical protein